MVTLLSKLQKTTRLFALVALTLALGAMTARAQSTSWSGSATRPGGGTLTWTVTEDQGRCGYAGEDQLTWWDFSDFYFNGAQVQSGIVTGYLEDIGYDAGAGCPASSAFTGPITFTLPGSAGSVTITPEDGGYLQVTWN